METQVIVSVECEGCELCNLLGENGCPFYEEPVFVNPSHLSSIEYFALTHFADEKWTRRQDLNVFQSIAVPALATAWLLFIALMSY